MAEQFSLEWAKGIIDDNVQKAQTFIDDPEQINGLLEELQAKMEGLPDTVSKAFNNVPVMADMVKSYTPMCLPRSSFRSSAHSSIW